MTECSPVTHVNPKKGIKFGSCGIAVHNTEFKVRSLISVISLKNISMRGSSDVRSY